MIKDLGLALRDTGFLIRGPNPTARSSHFINCDSKLVICDSDDVHSSWTLRDSPTAFSRHSCIFPFEENFLNIKSDVLDDPEVSADSRDVVSPVGPASARM